MGLRLMTANDGTCEHGILYCSTTMRALPFIFRSTDDAEAFVALHGDVRRFSEAEREILFSSWERSTPPDADTPHPLDPR